MLLHIENGVPASSVSALCFKDRAAGTSKLRTVGLWLIVLFFPVTVRPSAALDPQAVTGAQVENGFEVATDEFPYVVALGFYDGDGQFLSSCGGTLVAADWVLTAAHCGASAQHAYFGKKLPPDSGATIVSTLERWCHEDFDYATYANDIAMVKLKSAVSVVPANLSSSASPADADQVTLVGWGLIHSKLQGVKQNIEDNDVCARQIIDKSLPWVVDDTKICIEEGAAGSVAWDSGGPVLRDSGSSNEVVGVIVVGGALCEIHSSVTHYRSWIQSILNGAPVDADKCPGSP